MRNYYKDIDWNKRFKGTKAGTLTLDNKLVCNILEAGNAIIINTKHPLTQQQSFDTVASANQYLLKISSLGECV